MKIPKRNAQIDVARCDCVLVDSASGTVLLNRPHIATLVDTSTRMILRAGIGRTSAEAISAAMAQGERGLGR